MKNKLDNNVFKNIKRVSGYKAINKLTSNFIHNIDSNVMVV